MDYWLKIFELLWAAKLWNEGLMNPWITPLNHIWIGDVSEIQNLKKNEV